MTADRWARVKALFEAAAERPAAERRGFLAAEAAGDETLQREVESLLASDVDEADFLGRIPFESPDLAAWFDDQDVHGTHDLLDGAQGAGQARDVDRAGTTFGRYRLVRLLGEGGMGSVWLAEQQHPIRRSVAVKVVRPGRDSRDVLSRFQSERQALALLSHPHVAKVLDAGVTDDGRPYFVMECVDGPPITEFANREALTLEARLRLFLQVCDGVQHAHQRGLLHRDLKPGNILVSDRDGWPVAHVIDFGIAKAVGTPLTGDTPATGIGAIVGTPDYMSPEQAGLVDATVDTRTDIYSLGLVLHELLVGALPFDPFERRRNTALGSLRGIGQAEPPPLTARLRALGKQEADEVARLRRTPLPLLRRQLRGELEWIVARALEREPARRYASVSELRADIGRHLRGEPVLAGPPSTVYRLRKIAGRHRAAVAALAVVALAVAASAVVSTLALVRALRAEDRTRQQLVASLVTQGMQKVDAADPLAGLVFLVRALELETDVERVRGHRLRIGETLKRVPRLVGLWEGGTHMLAVSSRGLVATVGAGGSIKIRDLATGRPSAADLRQAADVTDGEFSSDGAVLATATADGRVCLWDPASGRLTREFALPTQVSDVALSPDGRLVAAIAIDGTVAVWDARRGTRLLAGRHLGEGRHAVFSHGGTLLATAGEDGVRLWQVAAGTAAALVLRHDGTRGVGHVTFSADDRWLASAGWDATARLWDVRSMAPVGAVMRHEASVTGVTFAGPGLLVTTSIDRATRTWRVPDASPVGPVRRSATVVQQPADVSRHLVIASPTQGGSVDLWSVDGDRPIVSLPHGGQAIVRFDATGRFLVTAADDGLARIWDLSPALGSVPRIAHDEWDVAGQLVASGDGRLVAVSSAGRSNRGVARVFDVATGAPVTPAMRFDAANLPISLSTDGRRVLTASDTGHVRVWDVQTGEPLTALLREESVVRFAAFSSDGERFVVAGGAGDGANPGARLRRTRDGATLSAWLRHDGAIYGARFSHDGRRLLIVGESGRSNITVWDVASGRLEWAADHAGNVHAALWSPDGATVFTGGPDQWVRAWDGPSGDPRRAAVKVVGAVSALDVTGDGARLLAGTAAGDVRLVDLAHGGPVVAAMRHQGYVFQCRFSPDGSLAVTSASDSTVRLWDGRTGEPLSPSLSAERIGRAATFLGEGTAVAWGGVGVHVDDLAVEDRPVASLRMFAESSAGRAISVSGIEVALDAAEIDTRFRALKGAWREATASSFVEYNRARARQAWRQGAFEEVASGLALVRTRGVLHWPDFMRLVGAAAATGRWRDALGELRAQRAHWRAVPELLFLEAVALARLGEEAAAARLCRAALEATDHTEHPERAYWAARACLVPATVAPRDVADLEDRIRLAHPRMADTLGQAELRGAMRLRTGRAREAFDLLASAVTPSSHVRTAVLLVASAAAQSGLTGEAATWLARADQIATAPVYDHLRPWFDAEADILRERVVRTLGERRGR